MEIHPKCLNWCCFSLKKTVYLLLRGLHSLLESVTSSGSLEGPGFTGDPPGPLSHLGLDPELVS